MDRSTRDQTFTPETAVRVVYDEDLETKKP